MIEQAQTVHRLVVWDNPEEGTISIVSTRPGASLGFDTLATINIQAFSGDVTEAMKFAYLLAASMDLLKCCRSFLLRLDIEADKLKNDCPMFLCSDKRNMLRTAIAKALTD